MSGSSYQDWKYFVIMIHIVFNDKDLPPYPAKNILQNDSVKQNHSADLFCQSEPFCYYSPPPPQKKTTQKADTYMYGALYISLSFSGCYFLGRMRAE
jgi:hypothetical protein